MSVAPWCQNAHLCDELYCIYAVLLNSLECGIKRRQCFLHKCNFNRAIKMSSNTYPSPSTRLKKAEIDYRTGISKRLSVDSEVYLLNNCCILSDKKKKYVNKRWGEQGRWVWPASGNSSSPLSTAQRRTDGSARGAQQQEIALRCSSVPLPRGTLRDVVRSGTAVLG